MVQQWLVIAKFQYEILSFLIYGISSFSQFGSDVTDHRIFAKLTQHWEDEFHKDMEALNVRQTFPRKSSSRICCLPGTFFIHLNYN